MSWYPVLIIGFRASQAARDTAFTLDPDELLRIFRTNVVGPAIVSQACLPFLQKGRRKIILNISSTAGSIATVEEIGARNTSYSISKAALNMLVRVAVMHLVLSKLLLIQLLRL